MMEIYSSNNTAVMIVDPFNDFYLKVVKDRLEPKKLLLVLT